MRSFAHVSLCLLLSFLCCTVLHTLLRPPSSSSTSASPPPSPSPSPASADPVTAAGAAAAAATAAPQETASPPTPLPPPATVFGGPPPLSDAAAAFEGGWWRRGPVTTKRSAVTGGGAKVEAEVEYYEDTCVGRLLVRPAGSGAAACPAPGRLSTDERWDGFLRVAAGPDYYRLRVEGDAELFAAAVPHVGDCRYAVHFRLLRAQASVSLDVKWETDRYNGVTEAVDTVRSFRDKYVARGIRVGRCALASSAAAPPEAAGTGGRYVRVTAADHPVGFPAGALVKAGEWLWQPAAAAAAAAAPPPPCRAAGSGVRILFVGDSQVRTVWRTWEAVLEGRPPTTQKAWRDVRRYGVNHTVGFEFQPLLSNVTAALLQGYDHVVMGFGAWPANSGWTHAAYARFVRRLLAGVAAAAGPRVVWLGAPAWPKPRHNSKGFRITNARLRMWNEVSFAKAREEGMRTVDFFGVSAPHMKLHRGDGMHYDHSVVLYSMVEEIARLTCLPTP